MATYSTQVSYDLVKCPEKMDEIYAWFDSNSTLAEGASLAYEDNLAILTIVNCSGDLPPKADCSGHM